jgi:IclR family transcriptional regulator, KDG regulon repressor
MRVLDSFAGRELGVSDVAREHRLTKSTAFRVLSTLRKTGHLQQDAETGRYRLGLRLLDLGQRVAAGLDVRRVAAPTMYELAQRSRGSVFLAMLLDAAVINVAQVESPDPVRVVMDGPQLGRLPHTIATGKVLLAHMGPSARAAAIAGLELRPLTPRTIVDRDQIEPELERVRKQGYAVNDQEQVMSVRGVAAPIRDHRGQVVAALSVAAPAVRLTQEQVPRYAEWACAAAEEISGNLGAPGAYERRKLEESLAL